MRFGPWCAVFLLAGCLTPPEPVTPEGDFVDAWWACGFVMEGTVCRHIWIGPDGHLLAFQGRMAEGSGSVQGTFHGTDAASVREALVHWGLYDGDHDFFADDAFGGVLDDAAMDAVLQAAARFYDAKAAYNENPNVADGGTLHLRVESDRGVHESQAYMGDADAAFEDLKDAVDAAYQTVVARTCPSCA